MAFKMILKVIGIYCSKKRTCQVAVNLHLVFPLSSANVNVANERPFGADGAKIQNRLVYIAAIVTQCLSVQFF